jgi:hypothetical protein
MMNQKQLQLFNELLTLKRYENSIVNKIDNHYFKFREIIEQLSNDTIDKHNFIIMFQREIEKYLQES